MDEHLTSRQEAELNALLAAREYGIGTILFRNALAKKVGLTLTESLCLTILGIRGVATAGELARFTGLTSGATTSMLDRLERRSFIRRKPNPDDRRGVLVEINEEYSRAAHELVAGIQRANLEVVAGFSEAELGAITRFLTQMARRLEEESGSIERSGGTSG